MQTDQASNGASRWSHDRLAPIAVCLYQRAGYRFFYVLFYRFVRGKQHGSNMLPVLLDERSVCMTCPFYTYRFVTRHLGRVVGSDRGAGGHDDDDNTVPVQFHVLDPEYGVECQCRIDPNESLQRAVQRIIGRTFYLLPNRKTALVVDDDTDDMEEEEEEEDREGKEPLYAPVGAFTRTTRDIGDMRALSNAIRSLQTLYPRPMVIPHEQIQVCFRKKKKRGEDAEIMLHVDWKRIACRSKPRLDRLKGVLKHYFEMPMTDTADDATGAVVRALANVLAAYWHDTPCKAWLLNRLSCMPHFLHGIRLDGIYRFTSDRMADLAHGKFRPVLEELPAGSFEAFLPFLWPSEDGSSTDKQQQQQWLLPLVDFVYHTVNKRYTDIFTRYSRSSFLWIDWGDLFDPIMKLVSADYTSDTILYPATCFMGDQPLVSVMVDLLWELVKRMRSIPRNDGQKLYWKATKSVRQLLAAPDTARMPTRGEKAFCVAVNRRQFHAERLFYQHALYGAAATTASTTTDMQVECATLDEMVSGVYRRRLANRVQNEMYVTVHVVVPDRAPDILVEWRTCLSEHPHIDVDAFTAKHIVAISELETRSKRDRAAATAAGTWHTLIVDSTHFMDCQHLAVILRAAKRMNTACIVFSGCTQVMPLGIHGRPFNDLAELIPSALPLLLEREEEEEHPGHQFEALLDNSWQQNANAKRTIRIVGTLNEALETGRGGDDDDDDTMFFYVYRVKLGRIQRGFPAHRIRALSIAQLLDRIDYRTTTDRRVIFCIHTETLKRLAQQMLHALFILAWHLIIITSDQERGVLLDRKTVPGVWLKETLYPTLRAHRRLSYRDVASKLV